MIILDKELDRSALRGHPPISVAMIGAGFMARGVAIQIANAFAGRIEIVGVANRTPSKARQVFAEAGVTDVDECSDAASVRNARMKRRAIVTSDPVLLAEAPDIDVFLEVTGAVEDALPAVLAAIETRKHVVLMNAELDGTVGPILKAKADAAGVVYTNVDGDQPGVIMNLFRFVRGIGLRPVLCGNIKGLQDPYRTPTTQAEFARRWGQNPRMVTSFADGTKISFEQAIVANATGMRVARRGMHGFSVAPGTPIDEAAKLYDPRELTEGAGIVDYVVGAAPGPGVFVLGVTDDARQRHYLNLYKLGEGPLYCFYTPYHLCHFEVPNTIARAVLFGDPAIAPLGKPYVEVVACAKRDLKAGETLDDLGGYMTYGVAENADIVEQENLLPIGVAPKCLVKQNVKKDDVLTYDDVVPPTGRVCDRLRREQATRWRAAVRELAEVS